MADVAALEQEVLGEYEQLVTNLNTVRAGSRGGFG